MKTINKATQRQLKYDSSNTVQYHLKLNNYYDKEIIDRLDVVSNKQGYIKELILNDMGSYMNKNRINKIMQDKVREIVRLARNDQNVTKVIIFGSSVTEKCRKDSDVDVYFESKTNLDFINEYLDFKYDLVNNYSVNKDFYENEILKKGVVVYQRNITR